MLKGVVYLSYVSPAILCRSDAWCLNVSVKCHEIHKVVTKLG